MNTFNPTLYEKATAKTFISNEASTCLTYLYQYQKKLRRHTYFHLFFLTIILSEILIFFTSFPLFAQSALLAFSLSVIFLTIFSYLILKIYFEAKKNENFYTIASAFSHAFAKEQQLNPRIPEYHLYIADGYRSLADHLEGSENKIIQISHLFFIIAPYCQRLATWWHWEDVHQIRELLLKQAILHHIELVKCAPTNLEVHYSLANMYLTLSSLYANPKNERWFPNEQLQQEYKNKFIKTTEHALEEFKILKELTPKDPNIYIQMANSYSDLEKPLEEIETYEQLLELSPSNHEIRFKLGRLYFEQKKPLLALQLYEQLKSHHNALANELIAFYGKEK